ncbi:hypothetical protein Bca52824_022314 [Brassica carinata]|uniref:Uncharacterized protein n=1 Tax=Brassica carinata TaxID=52824 RepID=A0A8X7VGB9_BRACI|nr:hypothetical protein Bca52824_022314 [Brassica carinata]
MDDDLRRGSMERSKSFFKALHELKNLRPQLYSAADYFEKSYLHSEQKQMVLDNLKDYNVKALVNVVDHLGTVASKLTNLLDQQSSDISTMELRACKLLTCRTLLVLSDDLNQDRIIAMRQKVVPEHPETHLLEGTNGQGHLCCHSSCLGCIFSLHDCKLRQGAKLVLELGPCKDCERYQYKSFELNIVFSQFLVVTVSQFTTLFQTTAYTGHITYINSGDFALGIVSILCGGPITKISHRAQAIASVASKWHAIMLCSSTDTTQIRTSPSGVHLEATTNPPISFQN